MTGVKELAEELERLLAPGRFGPMVLWLRGGGQLDVLRSEDLRVNSASQTLAVTKSGGRIEVLLEDVLAVGLRPRRRPSHGKDA